MIVKAEFPGYVIDVLVRVGQEVEEDEPLVLFEGTDAGRSTFYAHASEGGKVKEVFMEEGDFAHEDDDLLVIGEIEE